MRPLLTWGKDALKLPLLVSPDLQNPMSEHAVSGPAPNLDAEAAAAAPPDPTATRQSAVRVLPVQSRGDLTRFIKVPWRVYVGDQQWVPPLVLERRLHLSKRNPFFAHARARYWVAYDGSEAVGRISAQVDELHLERYGDATGYFGFVEGIDDATVFSPLLRAAETWLREQGMQRVIGPFNLSINEECGQLIEGFDTPPMFMMGHGRPYYDSRMTEQGYRKAKDTVAYLLDTTVAPPPILETSRRKAGTGRIRIRSLRRSHVREDLRIIRDVFNDAWSENWNFVPFTAAEFDDIGNMLNRFVPAEFIQIAEVDGAPAGMLVLVPNVNEAIRDLGGRLLPFGWGRLLWRLKRRGLQSARVPLLGVRQDYQRTALGMTLVTLLIDAVRLPVLERGIRHVELSWTLEDNRPMRHIKERIGARPYKKYRIYEKSLI